MTRPLNRSLLAALLLGAALFIPAARPATAAMAAYTLGVVLQSRSVPLADVGNALKLLFELRAGGYNGSTYTLNYDPIRDQLKGVYYQAVAKQTFEVVFIRK